MFLSPQPGDRYIDALYNHRSYSTGEDDMYGLKIDDEKSANIARIRLDEILKYQQSTGNFLEIGCGGGHTLLEARKRGFQVQGIEIAQSSIALCRAKGLDVLDISYNALDSLPPNTYAVVALYSVLEHTKNPVNFLEQLLPSLKKDGLLVIRVPNMTKEGPWLSLLDHFWHFESGVLKNILTSFGLIVVDAFPSGIFHGTIHRGTLESVTFVCRKS
jgi:2-polyprenyl-3-methyl-5-hydroxy-6-metoxy-1,4-benzoquinol methylase